MILLTRFLSTVTLVVCVMGLSACQLFFFDETKEAEIGRLDAQQVVVQVLGLPQTISVGDSVRIQVLALTSDGKNVSAILRDLRWHVAPTSVAQLLGGNQLSSTERWLRGVTVGQAEISVGASAHWLHDKSLRDIEVRYPILVVTPQ